MLINYSSFSGVAGLILNGNASFNGGTLQLTPDLQSQQGSAFWVTPIALNGSTSFSTNFQFQIGGRQGTLGADGMTFMLQNSAAGATALGSNSSGVGYGGIGRSLAIKFDTRRNTGELSDNYVGVNLNGSALGAAVAAEAPVDMNSGQAVNVWIDYDGATNLLSVYMSNASSIGKPTNPFLTYGVDLAEWLGNQMYVGFSAGTSSNTNFHRITNWQLDTPTTPNTTPAPTTGSISSFNYVDFTTGEGLKTNGSATQLDRVIRLTSDQTSQAGSVFTTRPLDIYGDTSFSTNFKLQFSGVRGTNGGEGITFVMQNSGAGADALGLNAGSLGYGDMCDSLAIKFDTIQGTGELSNNFVAVMTDGKMSRPYDWVDPNRNLYIAQARSPFDMNKRGTILNVWVDYNGVTDDLSIFLSRTANKPTTALITTKIRLSNVVGSQAYIGFTGATGASSSNISVQDVLSWEFSSSTPAPPPVQLGKPRILALGDSITQGVSGKSVDLYRNVIPGGYRRVLWNRLTQANVEVDFVGSETDGTSSNPDWQWLNRGDKHHQGMGGWTIEKITANVVNYINRENPNIIMLTIGTNNILRDASGSVMLAKLEALIDLITQTAPNVKLLVASIPPTHPNLDPNAPPELQAQQNQAVADYNNGMPALIEEKRQNGKNVRFVDMRSLTVAALAPRSDDNGVHPSMAGYDQIGTLWYNALLDPEVGGLSSMVIPPV